MSRYVTQQEIAKLIGCSTGYVSQLKNAGKIPKEFLKKEKDKVGGKVRERISTDFVDWYKENRTSKRSGPEPGVYQSDMSIEKTKADLAKTLLQAEKLKIEIEEKKRILEKELESALESALAERAAIFRQDLERLARAMSPDIVSIAGGNPEKVPEVIAFILKMVYGFLERYCG